MRVELEYFQDQMRRCGNLQFILLDHCAPLRQAVFEKNNPKCIISFECKRDFCQSFLKQERGSLVMLVSKLLNVFQCRFC